MSMHLVHPSLSTTGKKKGKQKFRNAEAAARARQSAESWKELQQKWGGSFAKSTKPKTLTKTYEVPAYRNTTAHIKSVDTGVGFAAKPADKVYTGTAMLGVATMHKSNSVPVFSQDDAIDIAKMRRG